MYHRHDLFVIFFRGRLCQIEIIFEVLVRSYNTVNGYNWFLESPSWKFVLFFQKSRLFKFTTIEGYCLLFLVHLPILSKFSYKMPYIWMPNSLILIIYNLYLITKMKSIGHSIKLFSCANGKMKKDLELRRMDR